MKTLADHNRERREYAEMVRNINLAGVSCDHCGAPMAYSQKTSPVGLGQHVHCTKCSYRGIKSE